MEKARERADLGFGFEDEGGFNPADWDVGRPAPTPPQRAAAREVAEATGFRSREAGQGAPQPVQAAPAASRPVRRRRTGRNAQFNLKARPDTIQSFCAVADAKGWGLGETLEYAVALLQREYGAGKG